MANILLIIAIALFTAAIVYGFLTASAALLANSLRLIIPTILLVVGILGIYFGRVGYGLIPLVVGALLLYTSWPKLMRRGPPPNHPTLRSAWLELVLDTKNNLIDGFIFTGQYEGQPLSKLNDDELLGLLDDVIDDQETLGLLEAYLNRRIPSWRDDTKADIDARLGGAKTTGAMTKQEAYQILGLQFGASSKDIASAYDGLVAMMSSDASGTKFLLARIDQAKDVLLKQG